MSTFKQFVRLYESVSNETLQKINAALKSISPSVEPYIIGGAVRDKLLGVNSKDIDFVVTKMPFGPDKADEARAAILAELSKIPGSKLVEAGADFGVITGIIDGEEFDFAIPRMKETSTGAGYKEFDVELDPSASIETDLSRRDFTINAMAQTLDGKLVDPLGGSKDLENGVIRAVGNPENRFLEDATRMLRAIQFASRLSTKDGRPFTLEDKTLEAMQKHFHLIDEKIDGNKILKELEKAWSKGRANMETLADLLQKSGIGKDLFGSDFDPVPLKIEGDAKEKMIAGFVGTFLNGGENKFTRHYTKGSESDGNVQLPKEYMTALKLFRTLLAGDKMPWEFLTKELKPLMPLMLKISNALVPRFGNNAKLTSDFIEKIIEGPAIEKDLDINGHDLMQIGISGRDIGTTMRELLIKVWNEELPNNKESLLAYLQK